MAGALVTDTPIFTERTIKGTARVQNNKTLLLASVASNTESQGRQGIPLLGLIPIIGRLFTAPTRDYKQIDIVIAITPKVIRAPAILPEDEIERPTGSLAVPTSGSLEAMVIEEDREEMLAAARRLPTTAQVQLPDQPADVPTYVRTSPGASDNNGAEPTDVSQKVASGDATAKNTGIGLDLKPIDTTAKTLALVPTADTQKTAEAPAATAPGASVTPDPNGPALAADFQISSNIPELTAGQKVKIPVLVKSTAAFRSAVLGLRFDKKKLAVRSVTFGDIFGAGVAGTEASPFLNQDGKMFVSLSLTDGVVATTTGIIAYVEVEALRPGRPELRLEKEALNLLAADGKNFSVRF